MPGHRAGHLTRRKRPAIAGIAGPGEITRSSRVMTPLGQAATPPMR